MSREKLLRNLSESDMVKIKETDEVITYQSTGTDSNFIEIEVYDDYYYTEYFYQVAKNTYNTVIIGTVKFT